jgi:hypothetical protein
VSANRFLGHRYWGVLHEGFFLIVRDGQETVTMKDISASSEKFNKQEVINEFTYFIEDVDYLIKVICYGQA